MKNKTKIIFMIYFLFCSTASFSQEAVKWDELKGDHFIIYYIQVERQDGKFARKVLDKAEVCYKRIASELGYQRRSNFWTWENRAKIYIYPDYKSYVTATGQPRWSNGVAHYNEREVISYVWSSGFLDMLLPHELAHLIFRDFVGFKGQVPLWLDEGVAQWMEVSKREMVKSAAKNLLSTGKLFPLETMMELDIRKSTSPDNVEIFYIEAVSLIGFLIEGYGTENFIIFCRQLRDGKKLEEALKFTYPTRLRSLGKLEAEWWRYIRG